MLIFPKKFNIIIYNKEYFKKIYFLSATFLLFCKVKRKRGKLLKTNFSLKMHE